MSKVITSTIKRWAGSVTLADPFTLPQADAINEARHALWEIGKDQERLVSFWDMDKPRISAIVACVQKWELAGFPESVSADTFPISPEPARHKLITLLWDAIVKIYDEEEEVPNES